ncbi:MAG: PorT family protein [Bacteroidales bacterium]|nr:PorT family protein [Bacteroidales bacterium]
MKRNFLTRAIAMAVVLMTALPMASFAQGYVYMYDRGHNRPTTRQGYYAPGDTYFGFRLGVNAANVNSESTSLESTSARAGLVAGLVGGVQCVPNAPVFFESGLMYVEKGGKNDYNKDFTYNLNYLEVPMTFKYMIEIPNSPGLSIQPMLGAYMGIGVGGYTKNYTERAAYNSFGSDPDQFRRFDGGLKIGCGLGLQMFYAEICYNHGLANIGHDMFDETHNRGVSFTVGINF